MREARPNLVVIVLDCVRATDFLGGEPGLTGMPHCEQLLHEAVRFPKAVSPAPWTIPAHASLFTGRPPWETGCHWKGSVRLSSEVERLPAILQSVGYRTMCVSSNPVIEPAFGLVDGFESVAWSAWWEPFLRYNPGAPGHSQPSDGHRSPSWLTLVRKGPVDRMVRRVRPTLIQHPYLMAAGNQVVNRLRDGSTSQARAMSRWVEPTFDDWVRRAPADQPIFAFVNLLDAHEPYFPSAGRDTSFGAWRDYASTRQDPVEWMNGDRSVRPEQLRILHGLYREMIQEMDHRVGAIVDSLQRAGRWDNTALVVTGDHGQAFGEHGTLFHFFRVDEQLIRVPLVVRFPKSEHAGSVGRGWASLIDIAPTFLQLSGTPKSLSPSGVALDTLLDGDRPSPVLSISDGIVWGHFRSRFSPENLERFDRVYAAAYQGNEKVVVDMKSDLTLAFDVQKDPGETHDIWSGASEHDTLARAARDAGHRTLSSNASELDPEVEDRLRAWGYV